MKHLIPLLFILLAIACNTSVSNKTIAIQPFGEVDTSMVNSVQRILQSNYQCKVIVLPKIDLPQHCFINVKSPRYRADKLLVFLKENKPKEANHIIGLTEKDISTTKKDNLGRVKEPASRYQDFGIFGLGHRPGPACVVSTFRLARGNKSKLKTRLQKVAIHEIGHNLGLKHCPNKSCVMTDAVEKMSTVDNAKMRLCNACLKEIE